MIKIIFSYALLALFIIFVFNYILMLTFIPSSSMEPTLESGDLVIGSRYDRKDIERYDIVIFKSPDNPSTYFIKRVIGLPGEMIVVKNGKVYANGEELDDSYIKEEMNTDGDGIFIVPDDCYFMMGDNRNDSWDSRFWKNKYVPAEDIAAKARFLFFPLEHIASLQYEKGE